MALATITASADFTISVNGASFSLSESAAHCAAIYDALWLDQEVTLERYREVGLHLIGIRSMFGNNDKAFGKFIKESAFADMSRQVRSAMVDIASQWEQVQKLNESGTLENLGVSAIQKRLKALEGKGAGTRKADQKAPKDKVQADVEADVEPMTEANLVELVIQHLAQGLDTKLFLKYLAAAIKAK